MLRQEITIEANGREMPVFVYDYNNDKDALNVLAVKTAKDLQRQGFKVLSEITVLG